MKAEFLIRSISDLVGLFSDLKTETFPFRLIFKSGEVRSLSQNGLYWRWIRQLFIKFNNIRNEKGLAYVDGDIFYCNWPQIVSKEGNKKMFLTETWAAPFEQTWMSYIFQETVKGNIKPAILLSTPCYHERFDYYDASERREN